MKGFKETLIQPGSIEGFLKRPVLAWIKLRFSIENYLSLGKLKIIADLKIFKKIIIRQIENIHGKLLFSLAKLKMF